MFHSTIDIQTTNLTDQITEINRVKPKKLDDKSINVYKI